MTSASSAQQDAESLQEELLPCFDDAFKSASRRFDRTSFGVKRKIVVAADLKPLYKASIPKDVEKAMSVIAMYDPDFIRDFVLLRHERKMPRKYEGKPLTLAALDDGDKAALYRLLEASFLMADQGVLNGFYRDSTIYLRIDAISASLVAHEMSHAYEHARWFAVMTITAGRGKRNVKAVFEGSAELSARAVVEAWKRRHPKMPAGDPAYEAYVPFAEDLRQAATPSPFLEAMYGGHIDWDRGSKGKTAPKATSKPGKKPPTKADEFGVFRFGVAQKRVPWPWP